MEKESKVFDSPKAVLMYYHSTLRNVGLFTSVSFGALAYSRYYRGKSKVYAGGLVAISIAFLALSFFINNTLNDVLNEYARDEEYKNKHLSELIPISKTIYVIHTFLFLLSIWTLYRMITNKMFGNM